MNKPLAIVISIHWVAVVIYVAATIATVYGQLFDKEKPVSVAFRAAACGLVVHGMAIIYWWTLVGHGPYIARFEVLSSQSWVVLFLFLVFARVFPRLRAASMVVFPATFLLVALSLFFNPEIKKLPPTLRSIWLVLHVAFYKIALGTLIVGLAFSVFYILKTRGSGRWLERLPDLETIDLLAYRFSGFGFNFWAIAMLAGSIWAYQSWGRFWGWDPIETWSLVTWIGFGILLHLRRFFGWQGERAAYLYIACFILSLLSLFFTPLIDSSIHSEYFR